MKPEKIGYIKAVIDFVLERPDLGGGIERYPEGKISNPDKKERDVCPASVPDHKPAKVPSIMIFFKPVILPVF